MAFKPNYRFARAERDRLKQAKKDEKLNRQRARASFAARQRLDQHDRTEICRKPDFRAAGCVVDRTCSRIPTPMRSV